MIGYKVRTRGHPLAPHVLHKMNKNNNNNKKLEERDRKNEAGVRWNTNFWVFKPIHKKTCFW